MVYCTRSGGRRLREWPGCPGCPPGFRPVGCLGHGLGASGGLVDGGIEELEAFRPARSPSLPIWALSVLSCFSKSAMRASRSRQPGHTGAVTGVQVGATLAMAEAQKEPRFRKVRQTRRTQGCEKQLKTLKAQIGKLGERAGRNASNSSIPPSTNPPDAPKPCPKQP